MGEKISHFAGVFCLYLALGPRGTLGFSWPVYVGHLYLLSVSDIWAARGTGFQLAGMEAKLLKKALVFIAFLNSGSESVEKAVVLLCV